ncbi:DsbA family protein [Mangrovibacter sp. MFB070]|uniref:DsbA family protein n=1 Tax=Mangrovibacter sp. MFB070 TaxID=1224318 RepID=UPI00068A2E2C|nr:DsbA family protein [Mangrovibacter sp. MFB070]
MIEFFDYQCVFCSRLAPELENVMQGHHEVRYVFKDWPIFASRWPASHDAAVRGLNIWKTKGPAAYMAFHNGIYRTGHDEGALTPADIDAVTRTVMKGTPLASGADSDSVLEANNQLAQKLGLTGTPGLIVMPVDNPTPDTITVLPGAVPVAQIEAAIRRAGGKATKS